MYCVQIGNKRYSGGVDGGVVPYAVRAASAAKLLRIGFVHKQYTQDKATFQMNNPHVSQVRESPQPVAIFLKLFGLSDSGPLLCMLSLACRLRLLHPSSAHLRKVEARLFAVCWLRMQCVSCH